MLTARIGTSKGLVEARHSVSILHKGFAFGTDRRTDFSVTHKDTASKEAAESDVRSCFAL